MHEGIRAYEEGWGEKILDKPELDGTVRVAKDTDNHDGYEALEGGSQLESAKHSLSYLV